MIKNNAMGWVYSSTRENNQIYFIDVEEAILYA
jgi:hypothetical protein